MSESTSSPVLSNDARALADLVAELIESGHPPESGEVIRSVLQTVLVFGGDGEVVAELYERLDGWTGATIMTVIIERAAIAALWDGYIDNPREQ